MLEGFLTLDWHELRAYTTSLKVRHQLRVRSDEMRQDEALKDMDVRYASKRHSSFKYFTNDWIKARRMIFNAF